MSINIKSSSPLNPSLTQEGWGPHLTSWPEDSAAGPLHCHNCGGVSCVDAKWKVKRGSGGNIDVKKTVWQKWCKGGGQRKAEYKKKRTSRGTKNSHSHSGSYMIRHVALPLWQHIDWNTFTYRNLSCTMDTTLTNHCQTEQTEILSWNSIVLLIMMCYNVAFELSELLSVMIRPYSCQRSVKMAVLNTCCQSACLQSWGKSSGKKKGSCQLDWDILKLWLCYSSTTISQNLSMASLLSSHHKV